MKYPVLLYPVLTLFIGTVFAQGATFTVLNTNDTGAGSLRQAIVDANANAGPDVIAFNIPSGGLAIFPVSALPIVSEAVTIDGTTQPGFAGAPLIELAGTSAGAGVNGLHISAGGSTVRGLVINRFTASGLRLSTNGNNVVEGCLIGTGVGGTNDLGNTVDGIIITNCANNVIGGMTLAARNVISGNNQNGVHVLGLASSNNLVVGNIIGLSLSNADLGNTGDGVRVAAPRNRIGGTTAAERNTISGNNSDGIELVGTNALGNVIQGNYLGTDMAGTIDRGNDDGVNLNNSPGNLIGGATPGAGNLISGNSTGVELSGLTAAFNLVLGNLIGTDASGAVALANSANGVLITSNARTNSIGGVAAGEANIITFNTGDGVNVATGTNNAIRGNRIVANGNLGIDIGANGVLANDANDADTGANQLQNYPLLATATGSAGSVQITGALNSRASATYLIDFYANYACDPSTNGEGQQYLGSTTVNTDAGGNANISATVSATLAGRFVTATATDPSGNTSEFSPCVPATLLVPGNNFVVTTTNNSGPGSLREAILAANAAITAGDTITFNIPGGGVQIISPTNALPLITDPVTIDGYTQPGSTTNSSPTIFTGLPLVRLDGTSAGSGVDGLRIAAGASTIRGLVITRFTSDAIEIVTNGNNVIEGCLLGIDTTNTNRPNSGAGVHIVSTAGNRVGGTATGARNVISGNSGIGIHIENIGASNNVVIGNLIGPDLTGTIDRGNSNDGVQIDDAPNNIIGGPTAAERNVISGNNGDGVEFFTAGASGNQVLANFIGTDATGALPLGNGGYGVYLTSNARNSIIGTPFAGNRIAFSGNDGVFIGGGTNNSIRGNAIFANGTVAAELGIDIGANGITANDTGDGDTGANQLQNFPQLTGATNTTDGVTVAGTLDSKTNTAFTLDFYSNLACDTAGNGEGATYLGSSVVTTDGAGSVVFVVTLSGATLVGRYMTATATDPLGNTSEFSPCAFATSTAPPQTYTVTNTNDSGPGSLRAAMEANNARVSSGPNTISFNIPGVGPHWIAPTKALPQVIEAVVINGFSQPGASPNSTFFVNSAVNNAVIKIVLSGGNAPSNTDGLELFAGNCVVRGLSIVGFDGANGDGVWISGGISNLVEGCFIGLEPDGSTRRGNGGYGVHITPFNASVETSQNAVGGNYFAKRNVISANRYGVFINGSASNLIAGNYVGTDFSGIQGRGNTNGGVYVLGAESGGNQIGGPGADYRNVISGNGALFTSAGVTLDTCSGAVVAGNFIGLDVTGTNVLFNDIAGLRLRNASTNTIGGLIPTSANIISGNDGSGLVIDSGTAGGNRIQGNFIGTDATKTRALGNAEEGIDINGGAGNIIGGSEPGAGNVIAGNGAQGIEIFSSSQVGNVVQGNFIGTDRTATLALGNGGSGLQLDSSRHRVEANVIAFNRVSGVYVSSGIGSTVTANSIHSNTNLGIDLGFFGVQANDVGDPDNGANSLQNYPVLTEALRTPTSTVVNGTFNSATNQSFRLEFFDNVACDPSNFGEGQTYLGFLNVTTDGSGNAGFTFVHPLPIVFGHFITATTTDTNGSTSEFSRCAKVIPVDSVEMAVTKLDSPDPAPLASNLIYTVTVRNNGPTNATDVVVTDVLPAGVSFLSAATTQGACSHTAGLVTCTLGGIVRAGTASLTITVRPTAFGRLSNFVSVASAQFDHTPENNTDTEFTQAGVADMAVALSASPNPVTAGHTLTYTVTAINLGPDPAPSAFVHFSIDEAFCPQSFTVSQGTVASGGNFFNGTIGLLPVNGSATLTVTGVSGLDGPLFSSASAGSAVSDPSFANNSAGDTTTVLPGVGLLQFEPSSFTANESDGTASITIIRTGGSTGTLTVQYTTTNGTALAGSDYTAASGTLTFASGITSRQFNVPLRNDTNSECNEILGLRLFNATGGGAATVLCANLEATLAITDDDGLYTGAVLLVSVNTNQPPTTGGAYSGASSVSADGRFVAFESNASDLVPGDDNFDTDVFVRDLLTGTTRMISRDQFLFRSHSPEISGNGSNIAFRRDSSLFVHIGTLNTNQAVSVRQDGDLSSSSAYDATISSNGNVIAFTGSGTDFVTEPDANFLPDVFVRDIASQTTVLVSSKLGGNGSGNGQSYNARISADGRYVAFLSDASDLVANDTNGATDVFLRDLQAGTTTLVSRNHLGTGSANNTSDEPMINADGRYVAFTSYARDVVANDNTFSRDVFLFDRIAGTNRFVSVNRFGSGPGNDDSYGASISANGRFIAFESMATNLVSNDLNGGTLDVFVRDTVAGTTVLVSLDCSGVGSGNSGSYGPVIAGDGRSVAFLSYASDLTSGDFGIPDDDGEAFTAASAGLGGGAHSQLFRRDLTTNRTELLSRNFALTGGGNNESYEPAISFQGLTVAFSSEASDLVENDDNFNSDVFAWSSSATPSEPIPTLTITRQGSNQVVLSWPSPSSGFTLESTDNLNSPILWTPVDALVTDNGLTKTVTLLIDTNITARFYRLRK